MTNWTTNRTGNIYIEAVLMLRRETSLSIALILSGLTNAFMLWIQMALIFHKAFLTHTPRSVDLSGWTGAIASVMIVLSAISGKPIGQHNRMIKVLGIIVVCLSITQFLTNRIYVTVETHHFY